MVPDAVLADRDWSWLATEQDKLTYFTLTHRIPRQMPSLTFRAEDARRSATSPTSCRSRSMRTAARTSFVPPDPGPADRLSQLDRTPCRAAQGLVRVNGAAPGARVIRGMRCRARGGL